MPGAFNFFFTKSKVVKGEGLLDPKFRKTNVFSCQRTGISGQLSPRIIRFTHHIRAIKFSWHCRVASRRVFAARRLDTNVLLYYYFT